MGYRFIPWSNPVIASNGLLTNLTAYYQLNGTTTEADSTAGARTLTNAAGANPASAAGILGTARGAAGDSKYLYSSDAAFSPGAGPFSVSFWVYCSATATGFPGLVGRYDTGTNNRSWCVLLDKFQPTAPLQPQPQLGLAASVTAPGITLWPSSRELS
jgi:hypothetical protein